MIGFERGRLLAAQRDIVMHGGSLPVSSANPLGQPSPLTSLPWLASARRIASAGRRKRDRDALAAAQVYEGTGMADGPTPDQIEEQCKRMARDDAVHEK